MSPMVGWKEEGREGLSTWAFFSEVPCLVDPALPQSHTARAGWLS